MGGSARAHTAVLRGTAHTVWRPEEEPVQHHVSQTSVEVGARREHRLLFPCAGLPPFWVQTWCRLVAGADVGREGSEIALEGTGCSVVNTELSWRMLGKSRGAVPTGQRGASPGLSRG